MQKVIIDPSIAIILELKPLGSRELRPIIFTADEDWPGTYGLKVWNSDKKNEEFPMPIEKLTVVGNIMTWWVDAKNILQPGSYYAEIYSDECSSIIYKGTFEILK